MTARTAARRRLKLRRERDKHDRAYVLAFMRESIAVLARTDISVDQKLFRVRDIAIRLAPAIGVARSAQPSSEDQKGRT